MGGTGEIEPPKLPSRGGSSQQWNSGAGSYAQSMKRFIAAVLAGAIAVTGLTACGDEDPKDPDQVEEELDELEEDVRESTP